MLVRFNDSEWGGEWSSQGSTSQGKISQGSVSQRSMSSKVSEIRDTVTPIQNIDVSNPIEASLIEALPIPAWITSSDGVLQADNSRAEKLVCRYEPLGKSAPCRLLAKCTGDCFVMRQRRKDADGAAEREGCLMLLPSPDGAPRRYRVFVSECKLRETEVTMYLHVAFDVERAHRIESYFQRVIERSRQGQASQRPEPRLTRRETEILDLLATDETLWGIADKLCLSYSTVRNHVQHILAKFGVHSIIEAVAYYLTLPEPVRRRVIGAANRRQPIQIVGSADNSL